MTKQNHLQSSREQDSWKVIMRFLNDLGLSKNFILNRDKYWETHLSEHFQQILIFDMTTDFFKSLPSLVGTLKAQKAYRLFQTMCYAAGNFNILEIGKHNV